MATSTNPLLQVPFLKYKKASTSLTLSGTDSGSCIVNDNATGTITVTLPLAKAGTWFRFYVNAAFTIIVQPRPTDKIGTQAAGASYTLAAVVGTDVTLTCIGDSIWAVNNGNLLWGPTTVQGGAAGTNTLTVSAPGADATSPGTNRAGMFLGRANSYTVEIDGSATSGQSYGLLISAGSTSADNALLIKDSSATNSYLQVRGDGKISGGGPTAGVLVDMTPDRGTFTLTGTGFTSVVTTTATWYRVGNLVALNIGNGMQGTSNATTFTMTGLPAAITPNITSTNICADLENNTVAVFGTALFTAGSGTITMGNGANAGALWTAAGTKGFFNSGGTTIFYILN